MLETKLLSKVLLDRNYRVLRQFNISASDFTQDRDVYTYITGFVNEYDHTPPFEEVVNRFPSFNMQPEVYDSFPYLCKSLKKRKAKERIFQVLQNEAGERYQSEEIDGFLNWIDGEIQAAKSITATASGTGTNYAVNGTDRKARYEDSKVNGSNVIVPLPYPTLNAYLDGGPSLSDYLLIQAFTNVGKSWLASHIATFAWKMGGRGVLHYSPELSKQQQEDRNDTLIGHFNNIQLRQGELTNEGEYFGFLEGFNNNETPYIIKTMEDLPQGLSLDVIEADLQQNPNIEVLLIDGFNLMNHGRGDRAAMSNTSRKLRQLFGKYNVLGIVVHQVSPQSEKEKAKQKDADENISPVPNPAGLLGFSETSAVIQDAAHVLSFDAINGYGKIYVPKTRGTGKEKTVDVKCNFNFGQIEEASPVDHF